MRKLVSTVALVLTLVWCPVDGHAQPPASFSVTYAASSGVLPDQACPPWTLLDSASPEDPALSGGRVVISTSGNSENVFYQQSGAAIVIPDPVIVEARLRFVSGSSSHTARAPITIAVTTSPNVGNVLFIDRDRIFILAGELTRGPSAVVDTDDTFHTYRIEINAAGTVIVSYDGGQVLTGVTFANANAHGSLERVAWGEVSIFAFGTSEWEFVKHNASSRGCAPTANAGADQTVCEGDLVTLAGSVDPDQGTLTVGWTQIGGATMQSLSGADTRMATFVAETASLIGETSTFEFTVSDGQSLARDQADVTIKHRNLAPQADAGADQVVQEGMLIQLDAAFGSFDPEGDGLSYVWTQTAGPLVSLSDPGSATPTFDAPAVGPAGAQLVFSVTVTDVPNDTSCGDPLQDVDEVVVHVTNVNQPPTAAVGAGQTVNEGALVQLDCSTSSDADGDPLSYIWTQTAGPFVSLSDPSSATPTFTAPDQAAHEQQTLTFQCQVSDGDLTDAATTDVTVQDVNAPPDCSRAMASPASLWPPDHKFSSVAIVGVSDPDDPVRIAIAGIWQDEPTSGLGDGDTAPDAMLPAGGEPTTADPLRLRRERSGTDNGRVYHVSFTADDDFGGVCQGTVIVGVPHDRKSAPVDGGPLYDSTRQ